MSRQTREMLTANDLAKSSSDLPPLRIFTTGSFKFAIFAEEIATIVSWRRPTPLPQAPPAVQGVVSIQGRMLTLLDPTVLLGDEDNGKRVMRLIVALRGDEQLALGVDQDEVTGATDIMAPVGEANGATIGVINHKEEQIDVLDVTKLFGLAIRGRERRQRRF